MFKAKRLLFIYTETPLHVGSGQALGIVDLPIQRERITQYPMIQASSLKGRLRAELDPAHSPSKLSKAEHLALFGPEAGEGAADYAGALSIGDAHLLLFLVRSLAGVFAWTTSVDALQRFMRLAHLIDAKVDLKIPPEPKDENTAYVHGSTLLAGGSVVLEDFSFVPDQTYADQVQQIGKWLAANALPQGDEYEYWRSELPNKLCILPKNAFRDFTLYATEIQTHIKIDPDKKTVAQRALWSTESLPTDCLLYAPVLATQTRIPVNGKPLSADEVLQRILDNTQNNCLRSQLGGDETTGQGIVFLRFNEGGAA